MTSGPLEPHPDLARLRRRIVWIPTAALVILISLDGVFEIVAQDVWNSDIVIAHAVLLLLVSAGGFLFSRHTFNLIGRSQEDVRRHRSMLTSMERRSLALLEKSSDLVVLLRPDGTVTYVSPAVTRVLGYEQNTWIGNNALTYVHADERDCIRRHLLALSGDASESNTGAFRLQHHDGTWRWIAAAWTNLLLDPSVEALVCNARDVSEEKRTQDLLAWQAQVDAKISELHKSLASTAVPIPDINELILRCARELTDSDHGFLSYIDPQLGDNLVFPATPMMRPATTSADAPATIVRRDAAGRFPGLRGFPLNTREPVFTNAPTTHPAFLGIPTGHAPLRRFLSVPVWSGSELVGQIAVANATRDYTERDLDAVGRVAECYALAIQRRRVEDEVASLARFPSENPHPILRLGPDGTVLYANASSAGLLQMWNTAVGGCAPAPWPTLVREALATGATPTVDVQCGECTYAFSVVPIPDAGHLNLYGRDVTDRKRSEEALRAAHDRLERRVQERTEDLYTTNCWLQKEIAERRRAENELRAWFDNVPIGLYRTTRSGRILDANPALVQFLGFPDKETLLTTSTAALYTNPDDRTRWIDCVEREDFLAGFEALVRRFDGKHIWVRNSARAIRDPEGRVVYYEGGIEDITALKESENELLASREQLRVLAAHLESVREEERTRIAREIHDELGQLLTGLKLDLAWLVTRLPMTQEYMRERIRAMSGLVDDTIKSVRRIATELRPGILDDLGLTAAIEWQTQEFQSRTGIHCEFLQERGDGVEDPDRRTALFRILQETLTNVARHAHATQVVVSLRTTDGRHELRVEDNGRGITNAEIVNRKALGILGIQERARLLGGDVDISGRPGAGTTIVVRIPAEPLHAPLSATSPSVALQS